jgi:hypothetical protein
MKHFYLVLIFSTTFLFADAQSTSLDDKETSKVLRKSAETMVDHFRRGQLDEYIAFVHPKIIQMLGGKEKMIAGLKSRISEMKDDGFSFKAVTVGAPSKILSAEGELQAVISQTIELENPDGVLTTKSSLIAVSNDLGKTWHFIDSGGKTLSELKKVFKTLSDELAIPVKTEPTFKAN